jgi:hypothetical protein
MTDLLGAALWYASVGLRVFPLVPGTKSPFKGSDGCHGASSNDEVIRGWWAGDPQANIGIATGYGVDVVDFDPPQGQVSRATYWCSMNAECPTRAMKSMPWSAEDCGHGPGTFAKIEAAALGKVLTPRPGGMHLYVPAGFGGDGNRAGIAPGVDYRGRGGYVLAPPSLLDPYDGCPQGGAYRFLTTPQLEGLQ